jgi:hypothetical protein
MDTTMHPKNRGLVRLTFAAAIGLAAVTLAPSALAEDAYRSPMGVSVGVAAGLAYWTENGPLGTDTSIGRGLALGYTLALRGSFEILPWLAFDARARLLHNDGNDLVQNGSFTTVGAFGAARFTLPLDRIRPYALLGLGEYSMTASGAGTLLVNGTVPAAEFGLGAIVDAGRGFEVGVEYSYSHLLGETLSNSPAAPGGDPSALSLFAQYRFGL